MISVFKVNYLKCNHMQAVHALSSCYLSAVVLISSTNMKKLVIIPNILHKYQVNMGELQ